MSPTRPFSPYLEITAMQREGSLCLQVSGDLDASTEPSLRTTAQRALLGRPAALELDLGGVTFCDVAAARGLAFLRVESEAFGVAYRVTGASAPVRRVLSLTGLDRYVPLAAGQAPGGGPATVAAPPAPSQLPVAPGGLGQLARDRFEAVVEGLFRVGLGLQVAARRTDDVRAASDAMAAAAEIDRIIAEVRRVCDERQIRGGATTEARRTLLGEVAGAASIVGFDPAVELDAHIDERLGPSTLARARRALRVSLARLTQGTGASQARIVVRARRFLSIEVADDGTAPDPPPPGSELAEVAAEAHRLGGGLSLRPLIGRGSLCSWWVPLPPPALDGNEQ